MIETSDPVPIVSARPTGPFPWAVWLPPEAYMPEPPEEARRASAPDGPTTSTVQAATQLEGPEFADVAQDPAHPGLETIVKMVAERTPEGWAGLPRMTDDTSRPIKVNPTGPTNDGTPPEGRLEVDAEHATRLIDTWSTVTTVAEQTLATYHREELAKPWPSYTAHAYGRGFSLACRRDETRPQSALGTGLDLDDAATAERRHRRWHPCADDAILERRREQLAAAREQGSARRRTGARQRARRPDSIER